MKPTTWPLPLVVFGPTAYVFTALAQQKPPEERPQGKTLEGIVVTAEDLTTPTKQTGETVYTGSEVTKKGMRVQGAKATVSVHEAIGALPGVTVESPGQYGLAAEQNNVRIRGVRRTFGAMTVEGVPNWGGNPIGPRDYVYDTENLQSIAIYKGAVPADLGTGVGARGGAIELRPLWPAPELGVRASQSIGLNEYSRTFARLDTGVLPVAGSALAVSYSHTTAKKWRGPGDLGPRDNLSLMLELNAWGDDEIKVWFNQNRQEGDLYKPLEYSEVEALSGHYYEDYSAHLTGLRSEDANYFGYNRAGYVNKDLMAVIPVSPHDVLRLNVKPYSSWEDAEILNGSAQQGGTIRKRMRDIERYGVIVQADVRLPLATATMGHWFESSDMVIRTESYDPIGFAFSGHGMFTKNDGPAIVHSPFFKLAGRLASLEWQGGLKYFQYREPASQGYVSAPPDFALVAAPDLRRKAQIYSAFLPTFGVAHRFSDAIELYAAYGRNQIRPYAYMPLITLYNQNRVAFQAAGIALSDLFQGYDMELSDNFELGSRVRAEWIEVIPTVFYSKHDHLLTTIVDRRVDLSYYQNVGKATGHGIEVETNVYPDESLTLFANPTYTILTYDRDLAHDRDAPSVKGEQIVDTPVWSLKIGAMLGVGDFEIVPMVRCVGKRFGDAQHNERIDGYAVADLTASYEKPNVAFTKRLRVSMELSNIFGTQYVSVIQAMDDNRGGAASYYVGAPPSAMLRLAANM